MKVNTKVLVLSVALLCVLAAGVWVVRRPQPSVTYSQFLAHVKAGEVKEATVTVEPGSGTDLIAYTLANGSQMKTVIPPDYREAMAAMREKMVDVEMRDGSSTPVRLLTNSIPFFLLLGVWIFMFSRGMRLRLGRAG
jgi:ATP-dependent Zn protease